MSDELKSLQEKNRQAWVEFLAEAKQLRELKATLVKALIVAENQLLECSDKWTNVHAAASDQDWDLLDEIARDQQSECAKAVATVKAALEAAGEKP